MSSVPIVRVALPTPLRRLFDYRAGPAGHDPIAAGTLVRVPFGQRRLIGVAMETAASSELPEERLKPVLERLDPHPIFDPATLALLGWAADYYHHPVGEVLAAALPKALRLGAAIDRPRSAGFSPRQGWKRTPEAIPGARRASGSSSLLWRRARAQLPRGQMRARWRPASRPSRSMRSWDHGGRRRAPSLLEAG